MLAQDKTFCFGVPGSPATVEISAEGLRGILGQVEAELYRSEVYRRAVTNLQQASTEGGASAQFLLKAIGREAIRLALRQFVRQQEAEAEAHRSVESVPPAALVGAEAPPARAVEVPTTPVPATPANAASVRAASVHAVSANAVSANAAKVGQNPLLGAIAHLKPTKKPTAAELAATATQARQAAFHQLGEQIQQARQAQSLSLPGLHLKSLVPMHHLKAIEAGDLEHLPEQVYLRGFIQRIAPVLGLESAALLALLPAVDPAHYVVRKVGLAKPKSSHKAAFNGLAGSPLPLYVGYAALMTGGFVWLSHQSSPKSTLPPLEIDQPRVKASPATPTPVSALPYKALPQGNGKLSLHAKSMKGVKTIANVAPPETVRF